MSSSTWQSLTICIFRRPSATIVPGRPVAGGGWLPLLLLQSIASLWLSDCQPLPGSKHPLLPCQISVCGFQCPRICMRTIPCKIKVLKCIWGPISGRRTDMVQSFPRCRRNLASTLLFADVPGLPWVALGCIWPKIAKTRNCPNAANMLERLQNHTSVI